MQRYIVQPYDTLISIANEFGISHEQLLAVHPQINDPELIQDVQITNILNHSYIVAKGDTLNRISQHFNVPFNLLVSANPKIIHDKYITIGQQISIPTLQPPPAQLKEIESAAEDIMNAINMQDWDEANSKLATIKNNFDELKPIFIENSISPSLIDELDGAINNLGDELALKKAYESKMHANHITLLVSYILDYYKDKTLTDIDRLYFLGREIILNAQKNDWDAAIDNLDYVNVIWKNLEPKLKSVGKQDITEFSQTIDSLGQFIENKDSAQTIKQANEMLNQVSKLK